MKTRLVILIAIVVPLLVSSLASAQTTNIDRSTPVILSGGHYRLSSATEQLSGAASAHGYRLSPAVPTVDEGCCCKTHLPCVQK
jgi:hypothetical protein